jgi:hypothetical protein
VESAVRVSVRLTPGDARLESSTPVASAEASAASGYSLKFRL